MQTHSLIQNINSNKTQKLKNLFIRRESLQLKLNQQRLKLKESLDLLFCLILSQLNTTFYLLHYFDFRGRIYSVSSVGVTYNKIIRSLLSMPQQTINKYDIMRSTYYLKFMSELHLPLPYLINSKLINAQNLSQIDDFGRYTIANYLLEIGKLHKTKLLKKKNHITLDEFLLEGIWIINNLQSCRFDFMDLFDVKRFI
jgi:hypothetical protein